MKSHYELLGVAPAAPADEIQAAYRRLARAHHPDVNPDPATAERFAAISEAYRVLSDPRRRISYNHETLTRRTTEASSEPTALRWRELWNAWERVLAYAITGALSFLGFKALVNWILSTVGQPPPDLAIWAVLGGLIGAMWGIDANFVTSDFAAHPWQRLFVRTVRFSGWATALAYAGSSLDRLVPSTLPLPPLMAIGLGSGLIIALVATLRDH